LANLDEQIFGLQSTVLNAAAGGGDEFGLDWDSAMQSKLMRLSTLINLDSRLSVSCAVMHRGR
jgi:DNA mismatch repair protein MSH5